MRASADALGALLADDFREIGRSGRVYDKAGAIAALHDEPARAVSLDDFRARTVSPGVALCTYRTADAWRSSIWILRGGRWQIVFHQGTPLGPL